MDTNRLKKIDVLASLSDDALQSISTFAGETSVGAGKELVREGDYAYELMAIEEGEAEVIRDGQVVATVGPGEFFGEIGVLEGSLRTATVVAKTPMRLITFTSWELKRLGIGAVEDIKTTLEQRKTAMAG